MITMLLGGLWHGASWNFIIWGGLHGLYLSIEKIISGGNPVPQKWFSKIAGWFLTFSLVCFAWIFFRATSFYQALDIIESIFTNTQIKDIYQLDTTVVFPIINGIVLLFLIEWFIIRKFSFDIIFGKRFGDTILVAFSTFLVLYIFLFGNNQNNQFIYFQF